MADIWNDDQPIYRQLYERVVRLILQGEIAEGDALPSVRQLSADYQINHLTVAKAYQALVDEGLVEKRRGLGMFVLAGAREHLLARERKLFLEQELPEVVARARRLGIEGEALRRALADYQREDKA
ncbi:MULTISPECIES: GntR family transcriptional regulator [Marinimicrobium]|uniref:GntR family transcriptional regulator n=1 Tax=Marinimicrobium koreense TaxID=306545 RepID=A0A3N1PAQ9_9GAMM|nr:MULTISPECIES: GntR family transcriptional regulator [Marinimicrobium]MAN52479.1 GntR family transcriptional regulator [Marinimicrobium sp.]ROQ21746.1 GntR family transcriptional regulator [Marinimicrobium koreense]